MADSDTVRIKWCLLNKHADAAEASRVIVVTA